MTTTKTLDTFNSKDIYELFKTLYIEKHGFEYKGVGFIGNEMHKLRLLLDDYGSAHIACAVFNCVKANDSQVSVPYFTAVIKYYIIPYNPTIYWAVHRYGTDDIKRLWKSYLLLDSVWFPSATQRKRHKTAEQKLQEWAHAKTGQKTGKINTKTKSRK